MSGVMSTLAATVVMSVMTGKETDHAAEKNNQYPWRVIGHIANAIVFSVMGATVTLSMFEARWLATLTAIVAVFVARAVSLYGSLLQC